MDNTQAEVYKFKISYLKDFFIDLFGNSDKENDELIEKEVEEIRKQENPEYIKKLEKEMEEDYVGNSKSLVRGIKNQKRGSKSLEKSIENSGDATKKEGRKSKISDEKDKSKTIKEKEIGN